PFFLVSLIAVSARFSRNAAAVLLGISTFSARSRISCVFVKPEAILPPQKNRFNTKSGLILYPLACGKHLFHAVFFTQMCCEAHFYRPFRGRGRRRAPLMRISAITKSPSIHHKITGTRRLNSRKQF